MRSRTPLAFFVLAALAGTAFACRPGTPASEPVSATAGAILPSAGETAVSGPPGREELREADVLEIVRASLAAYPWRMTQSVQVKESGQAIESLTEAQSSNRGYNRSEQSLGGETIVLESILIDSTIYLNITGSPAETYGLVSGEWSEVPADSPLSQFVDRGAIDPAKIAEIFATDFKTVTAGSGELLFHAVGPEELNGVQTTLYEASGETFTYRWWIGDDGRFYRSTVDTPTARRTIVMEYDPGIQVQAPAP